MKSNIGRTLLSLGVLIIFAIVAWAGTSHFDAIETITTLTSGTSLTVGTTATIGASPISSGGSSIVKTMVFELDSIGYAANHMIFTPERAITILRGELHLRGDTVAIDTAWVKLVTGASEASLFAIACSAKGDHAINTGDINIPATACTLKTAINSGAYNGTDCTVIYWYTDDE